MTGAAGVNAVGIGLIGLGTIGTGVVKVLQRNAAVIERRLGFPLKLARIADIDTESDRGVDLAGRFYTVLTVAFFALRARA